MLQQYCAVLKRAIVSNWQYKLGARLLVGTVVGYLFLVLAIGLFWSIEPESTTLPTTPVFTGAATTTTLLQVASTLLDKPGGLLRNDIAPPGIWLDNMQNWEFGVLIQVRDLARALRKDFSRSQSQSTEDSDLATAEPQFNFDSTSWALPSSEGEYLTGIKSLQSYLERLTQTASTEAQFYARADNLTRWLGDVETRLGSLSQRLTASVGQKRLNTDLAGDTAATQTTANAIEMEIKTPWYQIDDVFYEARGASWALVQILRAVEIDFAEVLQKKNA